MLVSTDQSVKKMNPERCLLWYFPSWSPEFVSHSCELFVNSSRKNILLLLHVYLNHSRNLYVYGDSYKVCNHCLKPIAADLTAVCFHIILDFKYLTALQKAPAVSGSCSFKLLHQTCWQSNLIPRFQHNMELKVKSWATHARKGAVFSRDVRVISTLDLWPLFGVCGNRCPINRWTKFTWLNRFVDQMNI